MADSRALPDTTVLLEHAAFLKALARSLVHDEQEAEDVVQETLVAALRKPPGHGNLRAWMAAVTRNLSLSALTRRRRRETRERKASRRDSEPSVDEALERLEIQRRVVEAVMALEEPNRSVILHRFFYDRSLVEIAQLMGTPTGTARTRMRRGLEQLRQRLDREHSGDRRAWAVPLLACYGLRPQPLPGSVTGAPPSAPMAVKVAGLVVVAAIVTLIAVPRGEKEEGEVQTAERPHVAAPPTQLPTPEQPPTPDPEPEPVSTTPLAVEPPPRLRPLSRRWTFLPEQAGFVRVPAGKLHPGTTIRNIEQRAPDPKLRAALIYEEWGELPPLEMPAFWIGRYEVTNAQFKQYLDREHRVNHVTRRGETLRRIAGRYVRFRDKPVETEWGAIYAFNANTIRTALEAHGRWDPEWTLENPGEALGDVVLSKGIELRLYRHRTPHPWYGWCSLSHVRIGREFCDIRKQPQVAFKTSDKDFASYPVRDLSPLEMFAFAEWAGCSLPSEYEWERAVRGDRPNTEQYPFEGEWQHQVDRDRFSWSDNPVCMGRGPMPVDDERVAKGDTIYRARHMIGNVYELTRTFFDRHPMVVPAAPPPRRDIFNYALTAKGGCYGDGWIIKQISVRTGVIGNAELELVNNNRVDSLGMRLVRHTRPGEDLLRHSVLRLCHDFRGGRWGDVLPHEFALARMAGSDSIRIGRDSRSPYVHFDRRAKGIAFAPVWQMNPNGVVGVLRSDHAIRIDQTLTLEPGEWFVVWHDNRLGLTDKTLVLPPPTVFSLAASERVGIPDSVPSARLGKDATGKTWLEFTVETGPNGVPPPGTSKSEFWALCDVHPNGWPGRKKLSTGIRFQVPLDLVK